MADPRKTEYGPFQASQLREGDRYELSSGHAIYCAPSGRDHAAGNLLGGHVLGTDPKVEWAGIDAGFSPRPGDLRAPDIAVGGPATEESGWIRGTPELAVEYAGVGQDEAERGRKIKDLMSAGTRFVWVVRLVGPQRVEVYEAGKSPRLCGLGDQLEAPGVLANAVPVRAFFDREAGFDATLRNLLQRRGYEDLEAILKEGRAEGHAEGLAEGHAEGLRQGLRALLEARGLHLDALQREQIETCQDSRMLEGWLEQAKKAASTAEVLGP